MSFKENKIYSVIFTFIITLILVLVLALINNLTGDRVRLNQNIFEQKAILNAFGISYADNNDAFKKYTENIKELKLIDQNRNKTYRSFIYNDLKGIIYTGQGLWGNITAIIIFSENLEKIEGMDFISQNETPGLGARITEKWFKDQFRGEKIHSGLINLNMNVIPGGDKDLNNSQFDGISGATRTSEGVLNIINESLKILKTGETKDEQ